MGWERRRNGRKYFYAGRRVNGRMVKQYLGNGPRAELASLQLEARKTAQRERRDNLAAAKKEVSEADDAIRQLEQAPLTGKSAMPQPSSSSPEATPPGLPQDVQDRIRTLLAARQAGDPAADGELAMLVEQYPALWMDFGDLGQQAIEIWLNVISGGDQMVRAAVRQKLLHLRKQFVVSPEDPAGQLIVDRVLATWLQMSHADARIAQNSHVDLKTQEFLARRQQQAQRQHLAALQSWRQWQRLAADLPRAAPPVPPKTGCGATAAEKDSWILPFPRQAAAG